MQHRLATDRGDTFVEQADESGLVDRMHRAQRCHSGESAGQRDRQQWLVELHHHPGRQAASYLATVPRHALGKGCGEVTYRTGIGDSAVAVGQFQRSGQRDGAGRLHLHHPVATPGPLPCLFECVDVFVEQAACPPHHRSGARCNAVAAGDGVDGDIDQKTPGPADQVGAHTTVGKFHQMRKTVQFADHDLGGLAGRRPGP